MQCRHIVLAYMLIFAMRLKMLKKISHLKIRQVNDGLSFKRYNGVLSNRSSQSLSNSPEDAFYSTYL
jgi:hypothetical protein